MHACRILPSSVLLLGCLFTIGSLPANELQDIQRQAKQGQQTVALKRINDYLDTKPQDVQAQFTKGVILAEQNQHDAAIKVFREITRMHPHLPEPYNNLAVLYAAQGQFDQARLALEAAIKTHPSYATAHENLGDIYARMATEAYNKALQLDSSNLRAQGKLALITDLFPAGSRPLTGAGSKQLADNRHDLPASSSKPPLPETLPETLPSQHAASSSQSARPADKKAATTTVALAAPVKPTPEIKAVPDKLATAAYAEAEIIAAVERWAEAWSSKNVDGYLASYAADFRTPNGEQRSAWEQLRRERISTPASIEVKTSNVRVSPNEGNRAEVTFNQSYRAGSVSMRTTKKLVMTRINGQWLIEQELTSR